MATRKSLKNVKSEDIPDRFTLDGKEGEVKVVSVHDGDTCDVVFELRGRKERFVCRLLNYNASELKKKPINGQLARDYLAHLVMGEDPDADGFFDPEGIWTKEQLQEKLDKSKNLVYAVFGKFDSFGRALVTLYTDSSKNKSINAMMKKFVQKLKKR
ncbi:Hypothetical predicted protein [Paramuricea clavata]|uniref:Uncharacterized protein n=1 Tax=Paramuricea clavata TaxID=317549 RepID=A0A7D9EP89_PARCT|nr:Hypothetical predicted protein [Paramuricea clavata]